MFADIVRTGRNDESTLRAVKTVYVLGYADKARWKKALGGQYGCLFIDEANIADMDFVREAVMRCDYFMTRPSPCAPRTRPSRYWRS